MIQSARHEQAADVIRYFSQRLSPPFQGLVQIAESERARAITLDGNAWEIQFLHASDPDPGGGPNTSRRTYRRAASIPQSELPRVADQGVVDGREVDARIVELCSFLCDATPPFPAADEYEYWLLDADDESPLAMIFSCIEAEQMSSFPVRPEWTALPAAVMPIELTEDERSRDAAPVNYRLERLVAERAGSRPKARWFRRRPGEPDRFPPLLLSENWGREKDRDLCQRYINRQSSRLLMLHGLTHDDRVRLELASRPHVKEVSRFFPMYPEIVDEALMNAIRIEARLRGLTEESDPLHSRRDGVLYI